MYDDFEHIKKLAVTNLSRELDSLNTGNSEYQNEEAQKLLQQLQQLGGRQKKNILKDVPLEVSKTKKSFSMTLLVYDCVTCWFLKEVNVFKGCILNMFSDPKTI